MVEQKSKFKRLDESIVWSMKQLERVRTERKHMIKQFVGDHYADGGSNKRVIVNYLALAVDIYMQSLIAGDPQGMVTTDVIELRAMAEDIKEATNQQCNESELGKMVRKAILNALFTTGILRVGICSTGVKMGHVYGEPFVENISIDNYFFDKTAECHEEIDYEGHDYWMDIDAAREEFKDSLNADDNSTKDANGQDKAQEISADDSGMSYNQRILLRDVWLPKEMKVLTYAVTSMKKIREIAWDGPIHGPYFRLDFLDVPDNTTPIGVLGHLLDIHELANSLMRKCGKQADAQKSVVDFRGGEEADVTLFSAAADGDGIATSGIQPETIKVGGVDPGTNAFLMQLRDYFNYMGGNLDSLGGLGPQSDTLGQDKLLGQSASARIKKMAIQVKDFVTEIYETIAWYVWTDPIAERTLVHKIPTTDLEYKTQWTPETRDGDFLDYNFQLDVYSMQDSSPETQLAKLGMIFQTYLIPMEGQMQQQGLAIDMAGFIDMLSDLSNTPQLKEIITAQEPLESGEMQGNPKPAQTTRTYERINRPGATRQGKEAAMSQLLMGGQPQEAEMAALGRSSS